MAVLDSGIRDFNRTQGQVRNATGTVPDIPKKSKVKKLLLEM